MSVPIIVVVLVAMGEAHAPTTVAMTTATQEVLGNDAIVMVREVGAQPNDDAAVRLETVFHAGVLVELTWPTDDHLRVHLHVHAAESGRWSDRDIVFAPLDAAPERGRTIGFAVASMVPVARDDPSDASVSAAAPKPPAGPVPKTVTTTLAPSNDPRRLGEVDTVAVASRGVGGFAGGVGGTISGRLRLSEAFHFRVGVGLRLGDVPPASASSAAFRIDCGLAVRAWSSGGSRPVGLGVRADFLVIRHSLLRPTPDDGDGSRGARWLPGAEAMLEASWSFVPDAALVGAMGVEVAFGTTRVFVRREEVAVIPRARILFELGLRARF